MLLCQLEKRWKDKRWSSAGGIEVLVLNCCADIWICLILQLFQTTEQPPQQIRHFISTFVQTLHGALPVHSWLILNEICLDNRCAYTSNLLDVSICVITSRSYSEERSHIQGLWVWVIGENRPHKSTTEFRSSRCVLRIRILGLHDQFPWREILLSVRGAANLKPLVVLLKVLHKITECVLDKKPHGDSRRTGSEPKKIELRAWIQSAKFAQLPRRQCVHD